MDRTKKKCKKGSTDHQCSVSKSNTSISSETFQLEVSTSITTISNTQVEDVFSANFNYAADFREPQLKDLLDYLRIRLGPCTNTNNQHHRWNYLDEEDRMDDKIDIEIFPTKINISWENNTDYSNNKILNKLNRLSNEVFKLISLK